MSRSTKNFHLAGRATTTEANESRGKLTASEEEILREHILQELRSGNDVSKPLVRETVHYIACQRNKPGLFREDNREHVEGDMPGKNWVTDFAKDKPDLKNEWERPRKRRRTIGTSHISNDIDAWLQRLQPSLECTKMLPENVYQLARLVGTIKPPGVVSQISSGDSTSGLAAVDGNHNVITVIECVSAADELLSPLMIQPYRKSPNRTSTIVLRESEDGRPTRDLFQTWVKEIFERHTRDRACGRPRVLVADPLQSCFSESLREFCKKKKIILCRAGTLESKRVESLLRDMTDLVQTLGSVYGSVFRSIARRSQRDLIFIYEQVRLQTSKSLTLNVLVPDGVTVCQEPKNSAKWSQVLQEHEDHNTTGVTRLGILKLIGSVEDDLLHGTYNLEARSRMKQLTDTARMLLKANVHNLGGDDHVMDGCDADSTTGAG